jgi:hypothetical protein
VVDNLAKDGLNGLHVFVTLFNELYTRVSLPEFGFLECSKLFRELEENCSLLADMLKVFCSMLLLLVEVIFIALGLK